MLLTKNIKTKVNGNMVKYYNNLGYSCKCNDEIIVDIKDMPLGSNLSIEYKCDYCGAIIVKSYNNYNKGKKIINKDCCHKCSSKKTSEIIFKKYGVSNAVHIPFVQDKIKQTNLKRYNCENPLGNIDVIKKCKETIFKKYGVEHAMQNEDIKEKTKNTCLKTYGCENPSQNEDVQKKLKQTVQDKYGVDNVTQNEKVRDKQLSTMLKKYGVKYNFERKDIKEEMDRKGYVTKYEKNLIPMSKNQKYLGDLYKGELNKLISYYFVDIYFSNENIYCEYDGGGHLLKVKFKQQTKNEYDIKEKKRYHILKKQGLKIFRIIHYTSKLPHDDVLLNIKDIALEFLKDHDWIIFNIDQKTINTKQKDIDFDFKNILSYNDFIKQIN